MSFQLLFLYLPHSVLKAICFVCRIHHWCFGISAFFVYIKLMMDSKKDFSTNATGGHLSSGSVDPLSLLDPSLWLLLLKEELLSQVCAECHHWLYNIVNLATRELMFWLENVGFKPVALIFWLTMCIKIVSQCFELDWERVLIWVLGWSSFISVILSSYIAIELWFLLHRRWCLQRQLLRLGLNQLGWTTLTTYNYQQHLWEEYQFPLWVNSLYPSPSISQLPYPLSAPSFLSPVLTHFFLMQ